MKIAVWGAGTLGSGLVFRLMTSEFTNEIAWINRSFEIIDSHTIDFRHGLSFAPTCREINCFSQENAEFGLMDTSILVVCHGGGVSQGQTRSDIYELNKKIFDDSVIKAINEFRFNGIVLVLTNHVDLMARYLQNRTNLSSNNVIGLGTIVETARLRRAISDYMVPGPGCNPNQIWPFAIGTHDKNFVPVFPSKMSGPGVYSDFLKNEKIVELILNEVSEAANRVKEASIIKESKEKGYQAGTMFPIVEGAFQVLKSIAMDLGEIHTVSVFDEVKDIYYSLPSNIGRNGIEHIHKDFLFDSKDLMDKLEASLSELKKLV